MIGIRVESLFQIYELLCNVLQGLKQSSVPYLFKSEIIKK